MTRRKNWEMIYNLITAKDAVATLKSLEEANSKVRFITSEPWDWWKSGGSGCLII